MKLYLVRHGKTQWNLEHRFQGMNGDSPLLIESIEQTRILRDYLSDVSFSKALTSPLKRAHDTAEILLGEKDSFDLSTDDRLKEWGLGLWEGEKFSEMKENYPQMIEAFTENPAKFSGASIGAEEVSQVTKRFADLVFDLLAKSNQDDKILLVGHGASLTAGIQSLLGKPDDKLRQDGFLLNSSLTILDIKSKDDIIVEEWNKIVY